MESPSFLSLSRFDATIFIFYSLSILATGLRLYSRGCVLHALGLDDILAFAAIVSHLSILRSRLFVFWSDNTA